MDGLTLAVLALLLLGYAGLSRRLDAFLVTPAIFFVTSGFLLGSSGLGVIALSPDNEVVQSLAEATLGLVLFADASRLDIGALRREFAIPARLLAIGLPLTIAAGAVVAMVLLGGLDPIEAVVLAIVLAPTDAALGQAVVTDPRLPSRIRQALNVESGLNDGLCVPLLFIALAIAAAEEGAIGGGAALTLVAEEIGFGVVGGIVGGIAGGVMIVVAVRRGLSSEAWLPVVPVAAAALAYGIAVAMGGSGFIAAFVGGFVFGAVRRDAGGEVGLLIEDVGAILNAATFVIFGAALIGPVIAGLDPMVAIYAVASLTLIRMAPVALALIGSDLRPPSIGFLGWFGPRGLASIVFAIIVIEDASLTHGSLVSTAIGATILLSVFAHGLSARPLTERYARWFKAAGEAAPAEARQAPELAVRWQRFRADPS